MSKPDQDLTQSIRGARDFYPQDLAVRNWLFSQWRQVANLFGYEEIDGPILESFDLFAAKSGEELVNQQMYSLVDRDERKLGVRPELTPTYARMIAKKQGELTPPIRWTMFGNVWRYEKPQRGRTRDFWQWELNMVGGDETLADAEIITVAAKALEAVGLTPDDVVIKINDRRLMQRKLTQEIGLSQDSYEKVAKIIDRKAKISKEDFGDSLHQVGLTENQIEKLNQFLSEADYSSSDKIKTLFSFFEKYGISKYIEFDPSIVRGITYYTGTVFECFDRNGEFRSVFGGGRFDDLVETFGGGKVPAVGFAIGDVVITELLKRLNKLPNLPATPTEVLVTIFSPDLAEQSIELASSLRQAKINTELFPDAGARLDKQLKYANKKQIPYIVVIGPEEAKKDQVVIKNMESGNQQTVLKTDLIDEIRK